MINVINFTRNKMNKIFEKIEVKRTEADEAKAERRNERIKEKNLEKKVHGEEKKLRLLEEEFKKVIG